MAVKPTAVNMDADKGLKLIFISQFVLAASSILACFAALTPIITITYVVVDVIGLIITCVGMGIATRDHRGFRMAMFFNLIVMVCDILAAIAGGWVYLLLRGLSALIAYMGMAYVCDSTAQLCGNSRYILDLETRARKLYLGCSLIVCLTQGLYVISAVQEMGGFMNFSSRVVLVISYVYYMVFLYQGRKSLKH